MKDKLITLLIITSVMISSCKSVKNPNVKDFTSQFFENPTVIYNLKKYTLGNEINILDSKNLISAKSLTFNNDDLKINIVHTKDHVVNYSLQQYTINKDLAFVVVWEYGKNRALWFLLNKGKTSGKWHLVDALERTTR